MVRRRRLSLLLAFVVVAAGLAWYAHGLGTDPAGAVTAAAPTTGERSVPADPSTTPTTPLTSPAAVSPAASAVQPAPAVPVATDPARPTSGGGTVGVLLTSSGWNDQTSSVEASGFVSGVVEQGGVCTLSLTQGGTTVTGQHAAVPDATTTSCGTVSVPGSSLAPGTWRATVSYASSTSSGSADGGSITVPAR